MAIQLKRAYAKPATADGFRVLVERLWPRGVSKQDVKLDLWLKDAAPSGGLRKWYGHDVAKWEEFKQRYVRELEAHAELLAPILDRARRGRVTFVFGSKEERFNSAAVLKEFIESRIGCDSS